MMLFLFLQFASVVVEAEKQMLVEVAVEVRYRTRALSRSLPAWFFR